MREYRTFWSRQSSARTKEQKINQWQEYARLLEEEIKELQGAAESSYSLVDILSDLVVDVENGHDTSATVAALVKWYRSKYPEAA